MFQVLQKAAISTARPGSNLLRKRMASTMSYTSAKPALLLGAVAGATTGLIVWQKKGSDQELVKDTTKKMPLQKLNMPPQESNVRQHNVKDEFVVPNKHHDETPKRKAAEGEFQHKAVNGQNIKEKNDTVKKEQVNRRLVKGNYDPRKKHDDDDDDDKWFSC